LLIYLFFCGVAVRENGWGGGSERVHSGIFIHGVSHSPNTKECITELWRVRYNNDCRWEDPVVPSCYWYTVPSSWSSHHLASQWPCTVTADQKILKSPIEICIRVQKSSSCVHKPSNQNCLLNFSFLTVVT